MVGQWTLECLLASNARIVDWPDDRVRNAVHLCIRLSVQPAIAWLDGSDLIVLLPACGEFRFTALTGLSHDRHRTGSETGPVWFRGPS